MPGWKVTVPASSANLGPGFDVLGLALDAHLTVECEQDQVFSVEVSGAGEGQVPLDESHLVIDTARSIASDAVLNCRWKIHSDIPMTRGLGSSAAACGAGLAAGFLLKNGTIDDKTEMFQELSRREGHADNAAAAIFGGLQAGFQNAENAVGHLPLPFPQHLSVLALIPATELSTASAREVLPNQHSTEAVSNNLAAITCLIEGLHSGEIENISRGCQDHLHQPYRLPLVPGLEDALLALEKEPLLHGAWLSGAGPTLASFLNSDDLIPGDLHSISGVEQAMSHLAIHESDSIARHMQVDFEGMRWEVLP